mgnify:CR=1 FL=1
MDILLIKKLIDDDIIDFDQLIKKTYKQIGLKETEAIFLMQLNSLKQGGIQSINPKTITKHLSLNETEATQLLDSMMQREYLSFDIKENKEGKTTESFSLDQTIKKMVQYYKKLIEDDIVHTDEDGNTDEHELAEILETQLQRQLKPLEIEIIIKWIHEYQYDKHMIKSAIIDAVKAGKTSISYIDGILLKKSKNKDDQVIHSKRKKSKVLKDFLDS